MEVLARVAAGECNKRIARALSLSPYTVKRHVANILNKLGLDSRVRAAAWWHERRVRDSGPRAGDTRDNRGAVILPFIRRTPPCCHDAGAALRA